MESSTESDTSELPARSSVPLGFSASWTGSFLPSSANETRGDYKNIKKLMIFLHSSQ